jgi:hypothetical protein
MEGGEGSRGTGRVEGGVGRVEGGWRVGGGRVERG